ncbi:hypothetical protein N8628_04275 [Verrucomicrobia bacterium]|nr:hypothetical protein [Verrucomicrobiota bacterium]
MNKKDGQAPAAHNLHHAKDEGRQILLTTHSLRSLEATENCKRSCFFFEIPCWNPKEKNNTCILKKMGIFMTMQQPQAALKTIGIPGQAAAYPYHCESPLPPAG